MRIVYRIDMKVRERNWKRRRDKGRGEDEEIKVRISGRRWGMRVRDKGR